tara:strand:- start:11491 stop:13164 length:1674 start_codon:yes stop_codon:yes gene_type:complete
MRIIEQERGPASAEDHEVFKALHLAGSGKVRASVDERTLSLETRKGHTLDLRLSKITRVHHHHTRLISFGYALFGCGLIYVAKRILIPDQMQIMAAVLGFAMILGWLGTRKPTLTLDTEVGDCHTITGNDASLMRLATLLKRLESGMTLEDARIGLDILERDTEFPRTSLLNLQEVPVEPVHLHAPTSISSFLMNELPEQELPDSILSSSIFDNEIDLDFGETENTVADWMQEQDAVSQPERPLLGHGLLERGIANAHDRRGTHRSPVQPVEQPRQQFLAHPHAPQPALQEQAPTPSYQHIVQAANIEIPHEYRAPLPTQIPRSYLPSFVNKDGAHVPGHNNIVEGYGTHSDLETFRSPDAILPHVIEEETTSLIEQARRETPLLPEIPQERKTRQHNVSSRLRPKDVTRSDSRLRPKVRSMKSQGNRIREMVVPAATQMLGGATDFASRLLVRRSPTKRSSTSTQELRQRSAQTHQSEAIESIRNLAQSRGGELPDHEIEPMLAHMIERQTIVEQELHEVKQPTPHLDEISFEELKDSKTHHAENAGKSGLPRLDV